MLKYLEVKHLWLTINSVCMCNRENKYNMLILVESRVEGIIIIWISLYVQNFYKKKYFWKYAIEYLSGRWGDWSCRSQLLFWKYLLSLGRKYLIRVIYTRCAFNNPKQRFLKYKGKSSKSQRTRFLSSLYISNKRNHTQNCTSMTLPHVTLSLSQYNPGTLTTALLKCAKLICT